MNKAGDDPYPLVRGLVRGLDVLQALNRLGTGTSAEVAKATGLARPTVHRLLETLARTGYVGRTGSRAPYRLTLKVRALSGGYKDDDWMEEIAAPILGELAEKIVWPTDIATYHDGSMVIRATTHSRSPLSIERVAVGKQLPMLGTAVGWAYLAFCPDAERESILRMLARRPGAEPAGTRQRWRIQREIELTRKRGYGVRQREISAKTSSIALPIRAAGRVLACINVIWIDSAMNLDAAVARFHEPLRGAAKRIESDYRSLLERPEEESRWNKIGARAVPRPPPGPLDGARSKARRGCD